ncbi:alpha-amylase/4-alpha-glucanotransferase domain-containing protein [Candidatus Methylacidithermus pantelleriae]|uniref:Alpha-amylase n=1 Tax=Candidatus Methylacidithermus pantelleriae TaxID=2744239 RepID=A0A8J2BVX7_9BACT|nr:alpha-amylase/4-alpha-glucanotransferase domain-containing protein [Candidatus Methylacidithermus pantelleriae]CAF0703499.1 Alpha-amylase [Candidatus Methylacidithermus pantelleriae]
MVCLKPVRLLWVIHFHQPLGNFPEIYERFVCRSCQPLLAALERHPKIRVALHFSGNLFEFIESHHPALLDQVAERVRLGQVELLGGGFYEPLLNLLPRNDALGQLVELACWISGRFGKEPKGAWLPESVWEPHFAQLLAEAGYQYTFLEDSLFEAAGWKKGELFHPFRTEYAGHPVVVFPIHRSWSRSIPFAPLVETKSAFVQISHRQQPQLVILGHNGALLGFWPQTYERLYEEGGLEAWLGFLEQEKDWLPTVLPEEVFEGSWQLTFLPCGAASQLAPSAMPTSSEVEYREAYGELANRYDADRFLPFFRAANWLGFLAKYPEAYRMYRKMLQLRKQLDELPAIARNRARKALWAAQEHSAYWHCRSGGVYANYLRDAVYQRLLSVEEEIFSFPPGQKVFLAATTLPGSPAKEWMLRTEICSVWVLPSYGGSVCEFSFLPTRYNVANTFCRRQEAYHKELPESRKTPQDWYLRYVFQDHFIPPGTSLEDFRAGSFVEFGDFVNQPYAVKTWALEPQRATLVLERHGGLYWREQRHPLSCQKSYSLHPPASLHVEYQLTNQGKVPIEVWFACELNYTCLAADGSERQLVVGDDRFSCATDFECAEARTWAIQDQTRKFLWEWELGHPAVLWHFGVWTTTLTEGEPERNYQGSSFVVVWPLRLDCGSTERFLLVSRMKKI